MEQTVSLAAVANRHVRAKTEIGNYF